MREVGIVCECENTKCIVSVLRRSACGENCANCSGHCTPTEAKITAENTVGAKKGDRVILELDSKRALAATMLVYSVPLLGLFLGVLAGVLLHFSELKTALLSVVVMCAFIVITQIISKKKSAKFAVNVVKVIS